MPNKLISLALAFCMLFCLSACRTTETNSNANNTPSKSQMDISQNTDEAKQKETDNTEASSNTEDSKENNVSQTQYSANQSQPTNTEKRPMHTHNYSNATCTLPKKCSCGATIGIAIGHNYSAATCTSPQICTRCSTTNGTALDHKYLSATCTTPKICERCNNVAKPALGHNYKNKKCTRCGKLDRTYLIEDIDYLRKNSDIWYSDEAVTDNKGNVYSQHYNFHNNNYVIDGSIYFDTGKKYTSFTSTVLLPYEYRGTGRDGYIKVYGDDKLLYQTSAITMGYVTNTFTVDITGVSILEIEMDSVSGGGGISCVPYLTDAYLEK